MKCKTAQIKKLVRHPVTKVLIAVVWVHIPRRGIVFFKKLFIARSILYTYFEIVGCEGVKCEVTSPKP